MSCATDPTGGAMTDGTFEKFMDPSIDWYAPNEYVEAFADTVDREARERLEESVAHHPGVIEIHGHTLHLNVAEDAALAAKWLDFQLAELAQATHRKGAQTMAEAGFTPNDGSHPPAYANIKFEDGRVTVTVRSGAHSDGGGPVQGPTATITMDIADFDQWIADVMRERQRV